jgi:hypothetical protein
MSNQNQSVEVLAYSFSSSTRLWIQGQKSLTNGWIIDDPDQALYSELNWLNGTGESGQCLSTVRHNKAEKMTVDGWQCLGEAWPYCEF